MSGRGKKEEGRRKKEEGRRKRVEGGESHIGKNTSSRVNASSLERIISG